MLRRAYSLLTVKSFDDDERIITGIATTITPDRLGDIVEPKGAEFKLPLPLLSQHDSAKPVGHVIKAKVTGKQIEVTAKMVKPSSDAPPTWKARLDEAWADAKSGLVAGLSIGFKPLEMEPVDDESWSYRFTRWLWLELSMVTIPANMEASIVTVKSLHAAASGTPRAQSPGASGVVSLSKSTRQENVMKKSYAEQIRDFQNARAAKQAELEAIMEKSAESGETLNAEDEERYDTLTAEITTIDKHLKRLEQMEALSVRNAERVRPSRQVVNANGGDDDELPPGDDDPPEQRRSPVIRAGSPRLDKGIGFARLVKCLARARGDVMNAAQWAKHMYPGDERLALELKAAVAAGTTLDGGASGPGYLGPLVYPETYTAQFIEYLRPQTIIGKFGAGGVPSLTNVPFNVRILGQSSGANAYWVGQGKPKPLTKFDVNATALGFAKVAAICVLTDELIRFSSPSADAMARDELTKAIRARLDIDFVDPAKAAVANVSPASITNGATAVPASGTTADALRADLKSLWSTFISNNLDPSDAVYITTSAVALSIGLMTNPLGQPEFPGMTMRGGTLGGVPVIVSEHVPTDTNGGLLILVKASDIFLADDGSVAIDASNQASLQMDDAPTDPPAAATVLVSMFQMNMTALRAERFINWARRRTQSVAYITGANYGG